MFVTRHEFLFSVSCVCVCMCVFVCMCVSVCVALPSERSGGGGMLKNLTIVLLPRRNSLKITRLPGCMLMQSLFQPFSFFSLSPMPLWPSACSFLVLFFSGESGRFGSAVERRVFSGSSFCLRNDFREEVRENFSDSGVESYGDQTDHQHQVNKVGENKLCFLSTTRRNWA